MDTVDHLARLRARLPSFMAGGSNFDTLLSILAARFQDIESTLGDLFALRSINTASGAQLDGIGQIVNLPRTFGQSDSDYRLSLAASLLSLSKSGTPEEVIFAYLSITGAPTVTLTEIYPATFQLSGIPTVDTTDASVAAAITSTIRQIKAAGVNMIVTAIGGFDLSDISQVDGINNGPSDADHGFGSTIGGETLGGSLSTVI
jgi:hypothetical protein